MQYAAQSRKSKFWGVTTLPNLLEFRPRNLRKELRMFLPHIRFKLPRGFLGFAISP